MSTKIAHGISPLVLILAVVVLLVAGRATFSYSEVATSDSTFTALKAAVIAELERDYDFDYRIDISLGEILKDKSPDIVMQLIEVLTKEHRQILINNLGSLMADLPAERLLSHMDELPKSAVSTIADVNLSRLLYPKGDAGVRQFQSDLGQHPDGELTMSQLLELSRRVEKANETRVMVFDGDYIGKKPDIRFHRGELVASGTWVADTIDLAYPVNSSTVRCREKLGYCIVAMANLQIPSIDSDEDFFIMSSGLEVWPISSWTENEVVAQRTFHCRIATLTINIGSHEVIEVHRNDWTEDCLEDTRAVKLPRPVVNRLVDGVTSTDTFWSHRERSTEQFFNPRLKDVLSSITE